MKCILTPLLLCLFLALSACCRHATVESSARRSDTVRITQTDTLRLVSFLRDTVHTKDSTFVSLIQRNDTVFITRDRWLTQWREHVRIDTLWRVRIDTVRASSHSERVELAEPPLHAIDKMLVGLLVACSVFLIVQLVRFFARK